MKRNRILFAILWVVSLVGISLFGGPISYGFFALLTILPLISFLYLLSRNFITYDYASALAFCLNY